MRVSAGITVVVLLASYVSAPCRCAAGAPCAVGSLLADANGDRGVDVSDPVFLLGWLFNGGPDPACFDPAEERRECDGGPGYLAGDCNQDGGIDISDPVCILQWLFSGGSAPACIEVLTRVCGDGVMSGGEICDDSNVANGDSCNPTCNLTNSTLSIAGGPGGAGGLAIFADVLWYADTANRVILRIDIPIDIFPALVIPVAGDASAPMGPPVDAPVGSQARFRSPTSLATDGITVWITDFQSLRAMTVAPPHAVTTVAGSASFGPDTYMDGVGTDAGLPAPRGATFHDGRVYFTDASAATVRRFDPTSLEVVTIAGTPYEISYLDGIGAAARFMSPRNTTMVGAGLLFVSDTNGSAIRTLDLETFAVGTFAGNGTAGYVDGIGLDARVHRPRGLTSDGTSVYWAESTGHTVRQGIIETASVSTLAGLPCEQDPCEGAYAEGVGMLARFSMPFDVVYHTGSNSLFVLDAGNEVIRRIR